MDPLERLKEGVRANVKGAARPVPLVATAIAVRIEGGIAVVTTERTFRNVEDQDIEPTLTFPVPTDAALFSLSADIDGRRLEGECQPKETARETYEDALDRGKAAVLHEELLKGVHMVSVGRVRPGAEVKVTSIWTAPLSFVGGEPGLRVPTTVGEIYGRQPLPDSDALTVGDHLHRATVTIECKDAQATLLGGPREVVKGGGYEVALNAPIEIVLSGWKPRRLQGVAADGRKVVLDVAPAPRGEKPLDVDLLVDRSGSMDEPVSGMPEARSESKFAAMKRGLTRYADARIGPADKVRTWQFDANVELVGAGTGKAAVQRVFAGIRPDGGSTELGRALDRVIAAEGARNLVIATDGKTWALDVQKYARCGARINVVLIGEDALDANVSALAGITGGEIIVPIGPDTDRAVADALDAARMPFAVAAPIEGLPDEIETCRRGAKIKAVWSGAAKKAKTGRDLVARAVAALAAALAVPLMREDRAAEFAASEGIVCHLTSLVLVDEAAEASEGIPANRKVDLSRPRTSGSIVAHTTMKLGMRAAESVAMSAASGMVRSSFAGRKSLFSSGRADLRIGARAGSWGRGGAASLGSDDFEEMDAMEDAELGTAMPDVDALLRGAWQAALQAGVGTIDWDAEPDALAAGRIGSLSPSLATAVRQAALDKAIAAAAQAAGIDPVRFVVGLLARAAASFNRTAARVARQALKGVGESDLAAAAKVLGI